MTTQSHARSENKSTRDKSQVESPQNIAHDVIEYLIEYSRANPGYAALWCLGAGFVLGWKLKPW